MKKAFINIVIPTYNASKSIRLLVSQLEKALADYDLTIILVDDASADNTTSIIEVLAKEYGNILYHFSQVNKGQQASLRIGLKMLTTPCEYVVTMDDDLQNPVEMVEKLIEKIQLGFDLVYAIPVANITSPQPSPSLIRRFGSKFRDALFHSFTNKPKEVQVSAFRIMTYELAVKLATSKKKYFYLSAEAFQYQIKVADICYPYVPRYAGRSSYTFGKLLLLYWKLLLTYKLKIID